MCLLQEVVYCESIKRELKTKPIYECRCYERLTTRVEDSTRLGGLEVVVLLIFIFLNSFFLKDVLCYRLPRRWNDG